MANGKEEESLPKRIGSWPGQLKSYFEELQTEMKRVTWPTWPQVRATTVVVIITTFAFAGYFAVVDLALGRVINRVFDAFTQ